MDKSRPITKCRECGQETQPQEYHPYAFCVLVKAGLGPVEVVREAADKLGLVDHNLLERLG